MFRRKFSGKQCLNRKMALALFAVFTTGRPTVAQEAAQRKPNPDAEAWIKEQVTADEAADLRTRWPQEEDRIISPTFLQDLLTSKITDVKIQRRGVRIYGAVLIEPIDLRYAEVAFPVELRWCRFEKRVDMAFSVFSRTLDLSDSHFRRNAAFSAIKVGSTAFFRRTTFAGSVDFVMAEITGQLVCANAKFTSEKHEANFKGMKVGGTAFFQKATFAGAVNFGGAEIAGQLDCANAKFASEKYEANFNGMKVGRTARFDTATFAGAVDFRGAEIVRQFDCDNAQFTSTKHEAKFNDMKVGATAIFRKATFAGNVDFADGEFLDLILSGTLEEPMRISNLDLSRTTIKRKLRFRDAEFETFRASSLNVKGPATLMRVTFHNTVKLDHADIRSLTLEKVTWPKGPETSFLLDDMTYRHLSAGEMPAAFPVLLELAEHSSFSASVYSTLEEFLMRQGMEDRADDVFVAYKKRLRQTNLEGGKWLWNWFLGLLVRHGRSPHRAFYACGGVLLIGLVVFWSKSGMQRKKKDEAGTPYNPLWYSLGLLLPFINLQIEDAWVPKSTRRFALAYMRLHTIAGWVLIPVGLAALTGFIR